MALLGRRTPFKPKLSKLIVFHAINTQSLTGSVVASSIAVANLSAKPLSDSESLTATYAKKGIRGNFTGAITSTGASIIRSFPKALVATITLTGGSVAKAISGAILSGGSVTASGVFSSVKVFLKVLQGGSIGSAGSTIAKVLSASRVFSGAYAVVSLLNALKAKAFSGSVSTSATLTSKPVVAPQPPIIDDYMEFFEEQP